MALIEEKAETEMDEITLEPSQAERTLKGQKPDKCLWELIREQNQAENHAKMVELGLIQEEKPKQVNVKRKKQPAPAPSRRSSRVKEMPKVNYDVDDDWEVEHFGKRRKLTEKKALSDKVEVVESRKSPRNLPVINYGQLDANMDDQILCDSCQDWVIPPCNIHGDCGMQFVDPAKLNLEVVSSSVSAAGQGLINRGAVIPKGTLIGPYTGKFVSLASYKEEEKKGRESGYAWLLYDSETLDKPYGYIDPGSAPDPVANKLAKANHPSKQEDMCLVGCQYQGKIFYRATKDILKHREVFVDYGPEYAAELGIDPSTFATYTRPENHKTEAILCPTCGTPFSSQPFLDLHLPKCKKKGLKTSIPAVKTGTKRAAPEKEFSCPYSDCGKSYTQSQHLRQHHREVHLKQRPFKCVTCGLTFTRTSNLTRHTDEVHLKLRPFSCTAEGCGATFASAGTLNRHILSQHSAAPPRFPCTHPGCSAQLSSKARLSTHIMLHKGERPFPCPYESCPEKFTAQWKVNSHIKRSKRHAGHRLASKYIDKHLLPFTCQVQGCQNRYETEVERDRHMVKLHPQD